MAPETRLPKFPTVGLEVCDCRFEHVTIEKVYEDNDTIQFEDGFTCSYKHCCDPVDHIWVHPQKKATEDELREIRGVKRHKNGEDARTWVV